MVNMYHSIDEIISLCTDQAKAFSSLTEINGIGESLANQIIAHFTDPDILAMINKLKECGLQFQAQETTTESNQFLSGTKWVITGSFEGYKPRTIAGDIIKKFGGEVIDSVSGKITHLLCGVSPGSKLDKANSLGVQVISEEQFNRIIAEQKL